MLSRRLRSHTSTQGRSRKGLFLGIISTLVIVTISIAAFLRLTTPASAAWFDDRWSYRQPVTFNNSGAATTNQKVKLDLDTETLVTASKMQADCDDARFTAKNGEVLSYFLDAAGGACNTASTDFYVLMPTIEAGDNVIYFYYGNNSATAGTVTINFTQATFSTTPSAGTEESGHSPVGFWSMDEGYGQTSQDGSTNNNDLTLGSGTGSDTNDPTWKTSDGCYMDKCLDFDGTDNYASIADTNNLDIAGSFTISAWIRPDTLPADTQMFSIISKTGDVDSGAAADNGNYGIAIDNGLSGTGVSVSGGFENSAGTQVTARANRSISVGEWYHVALAFDNTADTLKIYLDGAEGGSTSTALTPNTNNFPVYLGHTNPGAPFSLEAYYNGRIDEVRIYRYARSASQIKADYQGKGSGQGASATIGQTARPLNDNLVGYWTMEEASGNRTDSSGFDTTLSDNNTVTANPGKFGKAAQFTRTNDEYLSAADATANSTGDIDFTVTAWVNFDSTGTNRTIVSKTSGFGNQEYRLMGGGDDKMYFSWSTDGSNFSEVSPAAITLTSSTWYFVVAYHDAAKDQIGLSINGSSFTTGSAAGGYDGTGTFMIGSEAYVTANDMDGRIDEVRLYKRLLSPYEINQIYNYAPGPILHYNFDQKTGSTAQDTSGNDYSAALNNNASWSTGKYGSALLMNGSNQYSSCTDAACGGAGKLDFDAAAAFSWGGWVNVTQEASMTYFGKKHSTLTGEAGYQSGHASPNEFPFCTISDGTTQVQVIHTAAFAMNTWHHVFCTTNGSILTLFIDGVAVDSDSVTGVTGSLDTTTSFVVGASGNAAQDFIGSIDDVKVYNYSRTQGQIVEDFNGGHPIPGSPISSALGHWSLDEGYGDTANNSGSVGSGLNLSLGTSTTCPGDATCPSWTASGKFDKALSFDGTSDVVRIAETTAVDVGTLGDSYSLSAWFKTNTNFSSSGQIIGKFDGGSVYPYILYMTSAELVCFKLSDGTNGPKSCSTSTLNNDVWHHALGVRDGVTDMLYLYIDGKLVDSDADTTTGTAANNADLAIGNGGTSYAAIDFTGSIDEVKFFNTSLTADAAKILYNNSSTLSLGSFSTTSGGVKDNSFDRSFCVPGDSTSCSAPVAYFPMDENSGTSVTGDISGNNNTGTLTGFNSASWVTGKVGSALEFGVDKNVNAGSNAVIDNLGPVTITAWIYPKSGGEGGYGRIIEKGDATYPGLAFFMNTTDVTAGLNAYISTDATSLDKWTTSNAITLNTWNHVTMTWGGTNNASGVHIYVNGVEASYAGAIDGTGNQIDDSSFNLLLGDSFSSNRAFDGYMDEVRIYNYVRSQAQIAWDFNRGAPVANWSFDECQGTVIHDSAPKSNRTATRLDATLTIGGTSTNTSAGTCSSGTSTEAWNNGSSGKRNASISLDGTDDYASIADNALLDVTSGITLAAWVKFDSVAEQAILSKWGTGANEASYSMGTHWVTNDEFYLALDSNGTVPGSYFVTSTNANLTTGVWYHLVATWDADNGTLLYMDGKQLATSATGTPPTVVFAGVNDLFLGAFDGGGNPLDGQLDEAQIFSYALTSSQISNLYMQGTAFFGPATGTP